MQTEELLKTYIESLLEDNKVGISIKLEHQANRIFPESFSYVKGEHPFDVNYNQRKAYYMGLQFAYKDILRILENILEKK